MALKQKIMYVGNRLNRADDIAGTEHVWAGFHDVQLVDPGPAIQLRQFRTSDNEPLFVPEYRGEEFETPVMEVQP